MSETQTQHLLFELGTEELPAGPLQSMAIALETAIADGLSDNGLSFEGIEWFATPRRLAVLVSGLLTCAEDREQEILGPPAAAAKSDDGGWTAAALGFAKKNGVNADTLQIIDTDKGPRVGLIKREQGASAAAVAPEVLAQAVAAIPIAKRMRWGRERHEFLRPVQWVVALLDNTIVPVEVLGLSAGRETRGHRFHAPQALILEHAKDYRDALFEKRVIVDFADRRDRIRAQVEAISADNGVTAVIGEDLLDEVTGLVEWPVALMGSFDPAFLSVPAPALISSMKEHQKYFHLVDSKGDLQPLFITVANIESKTPDVVIKGNEKVIRPRLSDAAFFFETDKQRPLASRSERLGGVVFQHQLGSLADKAGRIEALAVIIAERLSADTDTTRRAAQLAKCDLVSDMVLEFPELQGIAGAAYAEHDGESKQTCEAIEQHYWPKFAGDELPTSAEAMAVALADRLDTLAGIFGIGQKPTGSKDPFALRRAAVGVIRIMQAMQASISLDELIGSACAQYPAGIIAADTPSVVVEYIIDRLRAWYEEQGIGVDVLRAVTALGLDQPDDIDRRVQALNVFATSEAATALAAANKRVANILAKAEGEVAPNPDRQLLQAPEEQALFDALLTTGGVLETLLAAQDYSSALSNLAALREPVDAFFEGVMVNVEDAALRQNRLSLLATLREQFLRVGDIAQLTSGNG